MNTSGKTLYLLLRDGKEIEFSAEDMRELEDLFYEINVKNWRFLNLGKNIVVNLDHVMRARLA